MGILRLFQTLDSSLRVVHFFMNGCGIKGVANGREAACNQSQLFPFIHDKIFVWIQKKESQGCHTAGNLSTIGFLLYDSALCLDPHMESSLTDFVYRAL